LKQNLSSSGILKERIMNQKGLLTELEAAAIEVLEAAAYEGTALDEAAESGVYRVISMDFSGL
jgi:hypothetical protein